MADWTLTARNFLIIVLKNATNALIVNVGAWMILPANFNFTNKAAIWNIAKLAGVTVLSRETAVWVPVLLKWSQSNADPNALQGKLEQAAQSTKQATADIEQAKAVAPTSTPKQ
jgi:hypothetical protein